MIANDLTKMQIIAAVAEADIGNVKVGQDRSTSPSMRFPTSSSTAASA